MIEPRAQTHPAADAASTTDASALARAQEKHVLLTECLILASRKAALEAALEDRRARLLQLMTEDKDQKILCEFGAARFEEHTVYTVDPERLALILPPVVLAQHVSVTRALYEGAEKAGVKIEAAVSRTKDKIFKVDPARSADAKSQRETFIEHTKEAALEKAHAVAQAILTNKKGEV